MADWKLKVGILFDSKEFEQGVTRIEKQMKVLDSEMKVSQSTFQNYGNTTDSLKSKISGLTEKIELQKSKVEGLRNAYQESIQEKGADATATQNLEIKVNNATAALNNMTQELNGLKKELREQPNMWDNMSSGIDKVCDKLELAGKKIESFGKTMTVGVTAPLIAFAKLSIDAINDQIQQETKLITVMKERMTATELQIQSVLELTQAEERKGIISQSTMLAGAQELATYLNKTETLNQLIPVLNDLVTQQYGYEASAEQVQNTATMLGKVMDGQLGALSRYGYSWTEAEERILKTGNEMTRAKLLTEILRGSIGEMNYALASTPYGRILQLKNNFEALTEEIGTKLLPILDKYVTPLNNLINKWFELDDAQKDNIMKMGLFAAAVGPALIGVGKLTQIIAPLPSNIEKMASGFAKGTSEVLNFGKGITDNVGKGFDFIFAKVPLLNKIPSLIDKAVSPIGNIISKVTGPIGDFFDKHLSGVAEKVGKVFSTLGDVAMKGANQLKSMLGLALKIIGPMAIIGLVLAGLGLAQQQFGEQIDQILNIAITKGPELISGFVTKITESLPNLINLGTELVMKLLDVIMANVPVLIQGAVAIITTLALGVAENADTLISGILDLIFVLLDTIIDQLPLLLECGLQLLLALTQGIVNNIDKIIAGILNVLLKLIDFIAQNLPMIIDMGIKIIIALAQGLAKAIPQLVAAIPVIVKAIFKAFGDVDWGAIGKSIIEGLVAGLKALKNLVVDTLKNIAKGAVDAFKSFFGINSPSTLFMNFGENIDKGLAIGLDNGLDKVEDAMDNLIDTTTFVPSNLDYGFNGLSAMNSGNLTNVNNSSKVVNLTLHIEHFENNRKEDVEEIMREMDFIAKKELLGSGGV